MSFFDDVIKVAEDNAGIKRTAVDREVATGMHADMGTVIPVIKSQLRMLDRAVRNDDPVLAANQLIDIAMEAGSNLAGVTGLGAEGNAIFDAAVRARRKLP